MQSASASRRVGRRRADRSDPRLFRREPLLGPSLNRWDEAMALLGVHFLARLLI
jgi:hypothetical protein